MCGRFVLLTMDEVLEIIQALEMESPFNAIPDWPARPQPDHARHQAYPGSTAPVITTTGEPESPTGSMLQGKILRWGFEASWTKKLLFNTRIETALGNKPGIWHDPIMHGRCIVPTYGFFEPHASETQISPRTGKPVKRQYRFRSPGGITLLGGVCSGDAFSVVTTAPNTSVAPVHDRMPLVLREHEVNEWLYGDPAMLADRSEVPLVVESDEQNDRGNRDDLSDPQERLPLE